MYIHSYTDDVLACMPAWLSPSWTSINTISYIDIAIYSMMHAWCCMHGAACMGIDHTANSKLAS